MNDVFGKDEKNLSNPERKNSFLKWGINVIVVLIVVLGAMLIYKNVWIPYSNKAAPTPTATEAVWKSKSSANVTEFITEWAKADNASNPTPYAQKAKELLTVEAQNKLAMYTDANGEPVNTLTEQLTVFVGTAPSEKFEIREVKQIDSNTVEVTVALEAGVKIFTTKSNGGAWLIDSVRAWGAVR